MGALYFTEILPTDTKKIDAKEALIGRFLTTRIGIRIGIGIWI